MVGGSADLTGSNNTKTKAMKPITAADYSGSYIYYGVREQTPLGVEGAVGSRGARVLAVRARDRRDDHLGRPWAGACQAGARPIRAILGEF